MPLTPATSSSAGSAGGHFWDRQLAPFISSTAGNASGPSTWREFCDRLHTDLLTRWLPGVSGRALKTDLFDEAAGAGLHDVLEQRFDHVVGIDVSASVAQAARQRNPELAAVRCDVRQLAFGESSFDAVVSNSTLDHFTNTGDIGVSLSELHRVTRPGGVLVVTLDNPRHPLVAIRTVVPAKLLRRLGLQPYFVGATLSLPRLVATLEATGWRVDDTTTMMHTLRVAAIPVSAWADRIGSNTNVDNTHSAPAPGDTVRRWLMTAMQACERLGSLPTRQITGHFIAVRAVRR